MNLDQITAVFKGSSGDATKQMYDLLEKIEPLGPVAVNLLRAVKTSVRAKRYRRGPGHITESYRRKNWSIGNACKLLDARKPAPFTWGWGIDKMAKGRGDPHFNVVYFDLPTGQVSFHINGRREGPDYPGEWDRAIGTSPVRICAWAAYVFAGTNPEPAAARVAAAALSDAIVETTFPRAEQIEPVDLFNGEGL